MVKYKGGEQSPPLSFDASPPVAAKRI